MTESEANALVARLAQDGYSARASYHGDSQPWTVEVTTPSTDWPATLSSDLKVMAIQGRGIIPPEGWDRVQPVWWRRLMDALTPRRVHTEVYVKRGRTGGN